MLEIRANRSELWARKIDVLILDRDAMACAEPITMRKCKELEIIKPSMRLDLTEAQGLMDELWSCGLRPSEGTGSAGSLAATERHLADMKKIAFHALKII
jgi:hypothetical protein